MPSEAKLEMNDVCFGYRADREVLTNVNLAISSGERVGLIGPSGCGKSTLSKILAGYESPDCGQVTLDGKPLPKKGYCPVQLIYQHPERAVNPRWKLAQTVSEGWDPPVEVLSALGIEEGWLNRWPNELSGGELQRFCIARALGENTKFMIADEMSTMLDVITQAQIWEFMIDFSEKRHVGMFIVTHDTALAERICTRILEFDSIGKQEPGQGCCDG